jgi:hypothetical protein
MAAVTPNSCDDVFFVDQSTVVRKVCDVALEAVHCDDMVFRLYKLKKPLMHVW